MTGIPDTPADWERNTARRASGLIEHHCLMHGVGHPNPGSALWLAERSRDAAVERAARAIERGEEPDEVSSLEDWEATWMVHGCCGCCAAESFPGHREALLHAHGLIQRSNEERAVLCRRIGAFRQACLDAGVVVPDEIDAEMLRTYRAETPPADFGWRFQLWRLRRRFSRG